MKGPVVLLGPPGAGKTTVGALAAERLGMRFVDVDESLGDASALFRDEGEAAFRVRELAALTALLDGSDVVIAAGAGIVESAPARALLAERALSVEMGVDATTAAERLGGSPRPWLPLGVDAVALLRERDERRAPHRAALAVARIDARGPKDTVAAALADVLDALRPVRPAPLAPEVVFDERGDAFARTPETRVVVERVVHERFGVAGDVIIEGGEQGKRLAHVESLAGALVACGLTREMRVVAVGGGALLDLVGLTSALLFRGVRWWSVPTTLLAQVDAGVGGKTAVNLDAHKNLLGAFHPPEQTVIARRFLTTLDAAADRAGRAEMLKHEFLAADAPADGSALIYDDEVARSLSLKLSVTRRDPNERGLRIVLNLGHTLGHALEAVVPSLGHGEAVRWGLLAAVALSVEVAGLHPDVGRTLAARVRALGPMALLGDGAALVTPVLAAMARDKKAGRWVLLRAPGLPVTRVLPPSVVRDVVTALLTAQ